MLFHTWKLHFWLVEGINPGWMENRMSSYIKKTVDQFDSLHISRGANAMRRFKRARTHLHLGSLPCAKSPYSTVAPGRKHGTNFLLLVLLIKCPCFAPKLIQEYLYGFPFSESYIRAACQCTTWSSQGPKHPGPVLFWPLAVRQLLSPPKQV